jgi:hypothetical protein
MSFNDINEVNLLHFTLKKDLVSNPILDSMHHHKHYITLFKENYEPKIMVFIQIFSFSNFGETLLNSIKLPSLL